MPAATAPAVTLGDVSPLASLLATTDTAWLRSWADAVLRNERRRTHLAVMTGPYLQRLVDGTKTVESRFFRHRVAPFGQLARDDVIFFKPAAGPIQAAGLAGQVHHLDLHETPIRHVEERFGAAIAPEDDTFWQCRADARYATLVHIVALARTPTVRVEKRDRRGWVVLGDHTHPPQI